MLFQKNIILIITAHQYFLFLGVDGPKGDVGDDGQNGAPGAPGKNIYKYIFLYHYGIKQKL